MIINNGNITSSRQESIHGNEGNDIIINSENATATRLYGDDGDDTITNDGIITDDIVCGSGNDNVTNNGDVRTIWWY